MSNITDGNKNSKSAKVLKLGFNISVSGDPGTDFEIVLDDKEQKTVDSSSSKDEQFQHLDAVEYPTMEMPKHELEKRKTEEVTPGQSTGAIPKHRKSTKTTPLSESPQPSDSEKTENSTPKDTNIIDQIKSTMEHFEKFSDHIKEIPRLRNHPMATSTPFSDKHNSKSDSNLAYAEYKPRKFSHRYDFYSRKEYFKSSVRPLPPDLFLKPLPAEGYYKRGIYSRFLDLDPYRYGSDNSLNKSSDYKYISAKPSYDIEKYEECNTPDPPGILKKSDSENGDKQSTSSADSIKDIKIYQSGGILIMQNFKDNLDLTEKKEMSEVSAKLIENCNKLKMEVSGFQDDMPAIGNSSDENKNLGKMVQFDLSSIEGQKSKSGDSSSAARDEFSVKLESSESTSDFLKNKDSSPQGTSQSQDFPSISTQENDSILSNQPGMSPSYASSKKLEWDSGADIGYLNLDLEKENLSTIEKIVLKGLSSDGRSEKNVVYGKQPSQNQRSKFVLERMPSIESDGGSNTKEGSKSDSKLSQEETEEKVSKGENRTKSDETKSSSNDRSERVSKVKPTETQPEEPAETTDKCINVNTLFDNIELQELQPPIRQSTPRESTESPDKPKLKKLKQSKNKNRGIKSSRKATSPSARPAMGVPKKVYKKIEAEPEINDLELSREVEEIIIDQRFKIKQNVQATKETEIVVKDGGKEVKSKGRPFSGSSVASNNTVLPKFENAEEMKKPSLNDQVIQTSDCDCESVGIQAFSSQISSDFDFKSLRKRSQKLSEKTKENVNTSSKNIQAFGLNSSLPKQLEHPKETEVVDNQHTKSTQFFGGPINSLPNYHSNLITKPGETCGRTPNILKTKKNSEAEIIRLKEENEKNILANDALSEPKTDSKRINSKENKENLITNKSSNSKRTQSNRRNSKNGSASQDSEVKCSEEKGKKKSSSVECSDCPHTSDEVSSMILTSEVLKVHGDSIDRNIIKEKYFQSQLVELEKRKMISRSTSMEMQLQVEDNTAGKDYTTTGCQYSPQSRGTSGGQYPEGDSPKENRNGKTQSSSLAQYASSQNVAEERFGTTQMGAGDSLPSSTQTAHSWLPGVQNSRENTSGVGRARSFEYLPGHIYESSGNLREELPSETEQNLITSSSETDTAKGSANPDGDKDSEGRNTLILENSSESSGNSNQMKILDDNLSRLSSALLKFWEKDAQVQSITQALLMNFWKKSGSGDWLPPVEANPSKPEVGDNEDTENSENKRNKTSLGSGEEEQTETKGKELSIACQTDGKSPSNPEKFYEDRKALEKRISEEKKSQIKWIENEIHHLNILRKLLEKQNSSGRRKKKQPFESIEPAKSEEGEKVLPEILPEQVTPVYGCTVIVNDDNPQERHYPRMPDSYRYQHVYPSASPYPSYSGNQNNWRNVKLSVGVQVSMADFKPEEDCSWDDMENFPQNSRNIEQLMLPEPCQSDVNTQCPSERRNFHSTIRTEFSSGKCNACNKSNCYCLTLPEKSNSSGSHSTKSRISERKGIRCVPCIDNDNKTSNSTDPEFRVMENGPVYQTIEPNDRSDLSESYAKCTSVQSTNCKCQNCPKKISSALNKTRITCQSNVYPNCDKHNDDCRCTKIQIQNPSNYTSRVIKIHGSKCGSSEKCKRRCMTKKTENQYCQTEKLTPEYYPKPSRSETRKCGEYGSRTTPERDINARGKSSPPSCSCSRKAAEKQRAKADDHPRHYFLRIEETEVEDSTESMEQKQSLEVITVKVPVKKAGKGKIYGANIQQSSESVKTDGLPTGCNCCSACGHNNRKQIPDYEPNYRRRAERPESPPRKQREEFDNFYDDEFLSREPSRMDYHGRDNEYDYSSLGRQKNDIPEPECCENCNCINRNPAPTRQNQTDYDSHKKERRNVLREYDECENVRVYPNGRADGRNQNAERGVPDYCSEFRYNGQELNPEYYDYNKREFMTKSELLKEQEQRRKAHQPTLQECLSSNRPDFYSSAERRRNIISQRSQDRIRRHNNRMECLMGMLHKCDESNKPSSEGSKRIFTSAQMREQTMKRYRKLPEVTGKIADQKKKDEYRTNRLMAEVFAKKLQIEALKGHTNLSNSVSVLYTV